MLSDIKLGPFFVGLISGSVQTLVGHPLDTIKVLLQNNQKINFKQLSNFKLFNGITPVLITNSFLTGTQFYLYDKYSPLTLGVVSGLLTTPIEYYKIQKQKNSPATPPHHAHTSTQQYVAWLKPLSFLPPALAVHVKVGISDVGSEKQYVP
jgi:hypothetical protein